ncbi:beta-N-acetylhexosaminidase [Kribbella kalugense]|uniref:beta-N-acetylhexosaminidase n=1 Tax=Kribbella kalugense TaxID=2512221 RepID=A0A4R7ZS44_9ACTN|nr:family 20 glycosylhydrolase [Kribbella kalugense]TDW19488.1 hexosaminidase [Kribbella kalugense]
MSLPLIPAPTTASTDDGTFAVTDALGVSYPPELATIAVHFADDLEADSGITLTPGAIGITLELGRDGLDDVAPAAGLRADGREADADERYGLEVTTDGIRIWGPTPEAVHRGLTSLRQLITANTADGTATLPTARVLDGPRFSWRGLSLDVVRTFHAPPVVRRVIDMCSLYKLNVLHLHLTDDQGWRVEVPSRPALTEIGAAGATDDRPGGFYSQAELAELVAYAAERFVTVVPEIDMPGHTSAVFEAYPELAPTETRTVELGNGTTLHLNTLEPGRPEIWTFVEDVLDAVIPQFPHSAYVHIGGDEAWGMSDEDHAAFVDLAAGLVRTRGKRVVGWQEIARAAITSDDVVQYWLEPRQDDSLDGEAASMVPADLLPILIEHFAKAEQDIPRALRHGSRLLLSPTSRLYFDAPHAKASSDPAQEELRKRVGLPFYPPTSIESGVDWDPVEYTPGIDSDAQVAGVEAAIWCETITTSAELEFMLLPRLAGAAEKAWSQTRTNWPDYATRLAHHSPTWQARTWNYFKSTEVNWP